MFFCPGVLKYVVCLCSGCDGCCVFFVFIVRRGAVGARVWECECFFVMQMYVCVLCASCCNVAFCMTCSFFMLVEDKQGYHMEEAYSRAGLITALYVGNHECVLLFTPSCCSECFYDL